MTMDKKDSVLLQRVGGHVNFSVNLLIIFGSEWYLNSGYLLD